MFFIQFCALERNVSKMNTTNHCHIQHHDYAFHGIGENFLIMESILTNGLVSDSQSHSVPSYFSNTNSIAKINTANGISVVYEYNSGAYNSYIKNGGISFLINDVSGMVNKPDSFPGESIVNGSIPSDKIIGVIVDSKLLNKRIEDFRFIQEHEATGQWIGKAKFLKFLIENRLGTKVEETEEMKFDGLLMSLENAQNNASLSIFERDAAEKEALSHINRFIGKYASKMFTVESGIKNPTMLDVINFYNKKQLPILDVNLHLLYVEKNPIATPNPEGTMSKKTSDHDSYEL